MRTKTFRRLFGSDNLPPELRGGVLAIGNFDGVHRGHQSVLAEALKQARALGVPALVLTFEPHPREFFKPSEPVARITPAPMRAHLLDLLGFDAVVEQAFDRALAGQSAEEFIERTLVARLGIVHVVTGGDFRFGAAREGDTAYLVEAARRNGFGAAVVAGFSDEGGHVVSSSRIRDRLFAGDVEQAAGLLGYRYTVEAEIVHGAKLGRELGYPTANMALPPEAPLAHGVYAVRLRRADGRLHDGVASFGRRPTIGDNGAPLLETFVFDFAEDLYGETCRVSVFGFLRGEEKFDGLDPLVRQMMRDEAEARALLAGVRPYSELDVKVAFG